MDINNIGTGILSGNAPELNPVTYVRPLDLMKDVIDKNAYVDATIIGEKDNLRTQLNSLQYLEENKDEFESLIGDYTSKLDSINTNLLTPSTREEGLNSLFNIRSGINKDINQGKLGLITSRANAFNLWQAANQESLSTLQPDESEWLRTNEKNRILQASSKEDIIDFSPVIKQINLNSKGFRDALDDNFLQFEQKHLQDLAALYDNLANVSQADLVRARTQIQKEAMWLRSRGLVNFLNGMYGGQDDFVRYLQQYNKIHGTNFSANNILQYGDDGNIYMIQDEYGRLHPFAEHAYSEYLRRSRTSVKIERDPNLFTRPKEEKDETKDGEKKGKKEEPVPSAVSSYNTWVCTSQHDFDTYLKMYGGTSVLGNRSVAIDNMQGIIDNYNITNQNDKLPSGISADGYLNLFSQCVSNGEFDISNISDSYNHTVVTTAKKVWQPHFNAIRKLKEEKGCTYQEAAREYANTTNMPATSKNWLSTMPETFFSKVCCDNPLNFFYDEDKNIFGLAYSNDKKTLPLYISFSKEDFFNGDMVFVDTFNINYTVDNPGQANHGQKASRPLIEEDITNYFNTGELNIPIAYAEFAIKNDMNNKFKPLYEKVIDTNNILKTVRASEKEFTSEAIQTAHLSAEDKDRYKTNWEALLNPEDFSVLTTIQTGAGSEQQTTHEFEKNTEMFDIFNGGSVSTAAGLSPLVFTTVTEENGQKIKKQYYLTNIDKLDDYAKFALPFVGETGDMRRFLANPKFARLADDFEKTGYFVDSNGNAVSEAGGTLLNGNDNGVHKDVFYDASDYRDYGIGFFNIPGYTYGVRKKVTGYGFKYLVILKDNSTGEIQEVENMSFDNIMNCFDFISKYAEDAITNIIEGVDTLNTPLRGNSAYMLYGAYKDSYDERDYKISEDRVKDWDNMDSSTQVMFRIINENDRQNEQATFRKERDKGHLQFVSSVIGAQLTSINTYEKVKTPGNAASDVDIYNRDHIISQNFQESFTKKARPGKLLFFLDSQNNIINSGIINKLPDGTLVLQQEDDDGVPSITPLSNLDFTNIEGLILRDWKIEQRKNTYVHWYNVLYN